MRIAVPKETAAGERRVALVPESCKKLRDAGYEISIEAGAGVQASFPMTPTVIWAWRSSPTLPSFWAQPISCSRSRRRRLPATAAATKRPGCALERSMSAR